jgi:hypothetical protein
MRSALEEIQVTEKVSAYDVYLIGNGAAWAGLAFFTTWPWSALASVPFALINLEYVTNVNFDYVKPLAGASLPIAIFLGQLSSPTFSRIGSGAARFAPAAANAAGAGAKFGAQFAGATAAGIATGLNTFVWGTLDVIQSLALGGGVFLGTLYATSNSSTSKKRKQVDDDGREEGKKDRRRRR